MGAYREHAVVGGERESDDEQQHQVRLLQPAEPVIMSDC
jgi:hypothetical protein